MMELLAQQIEVASITAAGMTIKAPIKVPRPKRLTAPAPAVRVGPTASEQAGFDRAIAMMQATTRSAG